MAIDIQAPPYLTFERWLQSSQLDRLATSMGKYSHDPAIIRALSILRLLPGRRCYHNVSHTAAVIWVVTALGIGADFGDEELLLNAHAAAFHDIGFAPIVSGGQDSGHEEVGAAFAAAALKEMGYDPHYADQLAALIKDTALVREASGVLHQRTEGFAHQTSYSLLDADVHNLGTDAFLKHFMDLFNERNDLQLSRVSDLLTFDVGREYLRETLAFVSHHRWATPTATAWFNEQKAKNVLELTKLMSQVAED